MKNLLLGFAFLALSAASAFAEDGQVLIDQSTVMDAGGFPYQITDPGSYKLSGNLAVPEAVDGIDIVADGVTLDLNGFTIAGARNYSGSAVGISSSNSFSITVKNGVIRGFTTGIALSGGGSLADLQVIFNTWGMTLSAGGPYILVRCSAHHNVRTGITAVGATISNSTANNNGSNGMYVGGSTVNNSTANANFDIGFSASASTLINNVASGNNSGGITGTQSIAGSNVLLGNTGGDLRVNSQGNNLCSRGPC